MNKLILIILILSLTTSCLHSALAQLDKPVLDQINRMMPNPLPPSPNVAGLGKFGDYKVDLFNGLPEISIPIFEIESGPLKVPIKLSYHASGIKPTDQAGWVGLGWALSAGGQISRKVNGAADENGYYASTSAALVPGASMCNDYDYLKAIALGTDAQPDVFAYSFPGKSGRFMLSSKGLQPPYLIPYEPVLVTAPDPSGPPSAFNKFEITDEQGVLHRFGSNAAGAIVMEGSGSTGGGPTISASTAWLLMEMIAPNSNDQISFSYTNVGTATYSDVNSVVSFPDNCNNSTYDATTNQPFIKCPNSVATELFFNSSISVNQQLLKTITFKTGKVEFAFGTARNDQQQLKSLDQINIYSLVNGAYILLKSVKFVYSYFRNSANTVDIELKLDAIQFLDKSQAVVQQYRFTYFTNSFSWGNPYAKDWWGFYNGKTSNTDLIPPTTINYIVPGNPSTFTASFGSADRSVSPQYLTEGTLKRIDFPTGGYTQFDYEPQQYTLNSTNYTGGGIRVSKITSSDNGNFPSKIKTYKYGAGESGYGIPNFSPNLFNYFDQQIVVFRMCPATAQRSGSITYRNRSYFSHSSFETDGFDTAPVIYPYVYEYIGDAAGSNIGKTVYEYDNGSPSRGGNDIPLLPFPSKVFTNSMSWRHGFLTHKTVYDNVSNKLSENILNYTEYQFLDKFVGHGVVFYNTYMDNSGICPIVSCTSSSGHVEDPNDFSYASLTQASAAKRRSSEMEYLYESGSVNKYVMKQTNYTYDPSKFLVSQTTITRSNLSEQSVTVNQYPFQLGANTSSTGAAQGVYMLNNKHILSTPIETFTYLQNTDFTNQRVVSGQVTAYRQNVSNPNYVVPDQIYLWESATPVAKSGYTQVAINAGNNGLAMDANQKPRVNLVSYDDKGNVQEVSRTNDVQVSYKYGYNNALPVAEVKNAQNTSYQTSQIVQATGTQSVTLGGPWPGTISTAKTFTTDYTGTVTLKLGVSSSPAYSTVATYSGITSGSVTLAKSQCGLTVVTFSNVAAGTYTLTIELTTPDSGVSSLGACGQIDYPMNTTVVNNYGIIEFLYESFEENPLGTTNTALAHSGSKYYSGAYQVSFTMPNSRSYLIEYFYLDASNIWQYITKPYTGTSMTLTEGSAIDDVRIYPADAQMKSYTYDPVLGIRSVIDESSRTYLYEYDTFGRLARIRNDKGGIEKEYTYNYKGN
jgi:YD repeat-containing protein